MSLSAKKVFLVLLLLPIIEACSNSKTPVVLAEEDKETEAEQTIVSNVLEKPVSPEQEDSIEPIDPKPIVSVPQTSPCNTCLLLVKDSSAGTNLQKNPIYTLKVYLNGIEQGSFATVTGRAYSQNRNRHQSGTQAPLPDGKYFVSDRIVPGTIPEVGDRFIAVWPKFKTGRTALGIHYDPSYNLNNGEDGTSGCIALTNKFDRDRVFQFIVQYHPQELIVRIQ